MSSQRTDMFAERVHVVFNDRELERITDFVIRGNADRVYYFKFQKGDVPDANLHFWKINHEVLRKQLPRAKIIDLDVDYTDYFQIIQELSKIIREERERNPKTQIFINLGPGSKVCTIASMDAANLWGAETYYVYSDDYDSNRPEGEPYHKGEMKSYRMPRFPITRPGKRMIKILKIIGEGGERGVLKKELIERLKQKGLLSVTVRPGGNEKAALYMALNNGVLRPLRENWNAVEVTPQRRNQRVRLTQVGEDMVRVFRYYE
ncbi:MAG: hypothetical protein Kow0069_09630 [Promethearchaeota archaeon]